MRIACSIVIATLAVLPLGASAQESVAAPVPAATADATAPACPTVAPAPRRLALGFAIDLLPTVLSATAGQFGMGGQIWVGIDHVRLRLVGAQIADPNWLAADQGFRDRESTVLAFIVDYVFGPHFDRWWVGTGFELWENSIANVNAPGQRATWSEVVWTAGGGYIFRFRHNFYVEPWAAGHVVMNDTSVSLGGQTYQPVRVLAEVSLKLGWFLDL